MNITNKKELLAFLGQLPRMVRGTGSHISIKKKWDGHGDGEAMSGYYFSPLRNLQEIDGGGSTTFSLIFDFYKNGTGSVTLDPDGKAKKTETKNWTATAQLLLRQIRTLCLSDYRKIEKMQEKINTSLPDIRL